MNQGQATRGETGKDSHGWGREGRLVMESFQTPFIGCLRTGALQEQDELAPLELLGTPQRNPDAETEQDPITTPPTLCPRPKHQPPNPHQPHPWFRKYIIAKLSFCCLSFIGLVGVFQLWLKKQYKQVVQIRIRPQYQSDTTAWHVSDFITTWCDLWSYQSTLRDRLL